MAVSRRADSGVCRYEYFDKVETGDLNVVLPNKFVAFSGPSAEHILAYDGSVTLGPGDAHRERLCTRHCNAVRASAAM